MLNALLACGVAVFLGVFSHAPDWAITLGSGLAAMIALGLSDLSDRLDGLTQQLDQMSDDVTELSSARDIEEELPDEY